MDKLITNNSFYDEIATEYDEMISFESAVEKKKNLLKNFINQNVKTAADIGCGTGVDSVALRLNGLKVSAFDPSEKMLSVAKSNSKKMNAAVEFYHHPADSIPRECDNKFDLIVSLGNTFANIEREKFQKSIFRCFDILKVKGVLLIQILNYENIIAENKRIVNITEGDNKYFIRFYDFTESEIIFNLLIFNKEKLSEQKLISTKLFPYTQTDFRNGLKEVGFTSIDFFSDFNLSTYKRKQSKDLIIRADKF